MTGWYQARFLGLVKNFTSACNLQIIKISGHRAYRINYDVTLTVTHWKTGSAKAPAKFYAGEKIFTDHCRINS